MNFIRAVFKWLLRGVAAVLLLLLAYVAYAHWAWRDLPVAELEARYRTPKLATVKVSGVPIRYELTGSGPLLVLIHSHYFDMRMWDSWVTALAPHYTVLRYDLSGHGLTGPDATGDYTVARDVALLDGLLQALQLDNPVLVGSSVGGNIAFTWAANHPQRTRALVLVNSGGLKRADKPGRSGKNIPAWADYVLPLVPPVALHRFVDWMVVEPAARTPELKTRFVDLWRREGNRPAEMARLRQFETGEPEAVLARITAPTLILWGEANPQLPVVLSEQFTAKLPHAARVARKTYPATGHVLPVERPEAVNDVLAFLKEAAP